MAAGVVASLLLVCIAPVGYWLLVPLEARFPADSSVLRTPPYGIIALGGDAGHRVSTLGHLGRLFPQTRLVYSGRDDLDEAVLEIREAGLDPAHVIFEIKSRTTFENAVDTAKIIRPNDAEQWLLIASGSHMPRAIGCFRHAGFRVEPYPVDLQTQDGDWLHVTAAQRVSQLDDAAKEWLGLIGYRIAGYTDALFPAP
jgi:uncharacterized SAM-binding protein YcdF (DUF218 family)